MLGSFFPDDTGVPSAAADSSRSETADLKFQIERLLILSEALWNLLKEKHGYTDEELVRQMVMVDMKDGVLDGKVAKTPPQPCPKCNRTLAKNRPRCLFCGEPVAPSPFAR